MPSCCLHLAVRHETWKTCEKRQPTQSAQRGDWPSGQNQLTQAIVDIVLNGIVDGSCKLCGPGFGIDLGFLGELTVEDLMGGTGGTAKATIGTATLVGALGA